MTRTAACDLNQSPCVVDSRWGKVHIEVSPRPIPVLTPINVTLKTPHAASIRGALTLNGTEMDMGPNNAALKYIAPETLQGQATIPICLTGAMQWRMNVQLSDSAASETLSFTFTAPTLRHEPLTEKPKQNTVK